MGSVQFGIPVEPAAALVRTPGLRVVGTRAGRIPTVDERPAVAGTRGPARRLAPPWTATD